MTTKHRWSMLVTNLHQLSASLRLVRRLRNRPKAANAMMTKHRRSLFVVTVHPKRASMPFLVNALSARPLLTNNRSYPSPTRNPLKRSPVLHMHHPTVRPLNVEHEPWRPTSHGGAQRAQSVNSRRQWRCWTWASLWILQAISKSMCFFGLYLASADLSLGTSIAIRSIATPILPRAEQRTTRKASRA